MSSDLFDRLNERDRLRVLALGNTVRLERGEYLIRRGERGGDLYRVLEGELEVVDSRAQPPVILDVVPKNGLVGELSFLDERLRSADVRAPEGAVCLRWERRVLDRLLQEDPPLGMRFFRTLSGLLGERLRATSAQAGEVGRPRPQAADEQAPRDLARHFEARLVELEPGLRRDPVVARSEIFTLLHTLERQLTELLEHVPEADALPVGHAIASELHPYLMRSHLGELALDNDIHRDLAMFRHVDTGKAAGDGPLGEILDEWLLGLRSLRALRERRAEMAALLVEHLPLDPPIRLMVIGANSRLLLNILPELGRIGGDLICVDDRHEALSQLSRSLEGRPRNLRLRLEHRDAASLLSGEARIAHPPLHLVVLDGILDALPEPVASTLLGWAAARLAPGGLLLANALAPASDDVLVRHLLDWPIVRRRPPALAYLLQSAGLQAIKISADPSTEIGLVGVGRR